MAEPQAAHPGRPLLVDDQQHRLNNSWTQPRIDQRPAWPRHVQGVIETQVGDVTVAEHVMRNAQQVMHRLAVLSLGIVTLMSILVDGEVQAGKTICMIALTSYAIACEFKLVVVLAGAQTTLRKQTQKRFQECFGRPDLHSQNLTTRPIAWLTRRIKGSVDRGDMHGTLRRLRLPQAQQQAPAAEPPEHADTDDDDDDDQQAVDDDELEDEQGADVAGNNDVNVGNYQGLRNLLMNWSTLEPDQKPVLLAVIKKDTRSLQALEQLLNRVPGLKQEKHLIIDDEYDAATLTDPDGLRRLIEAAENNAQAAPDVVPRAISRIRSQADGTVSPNSAYAGYTATSFAVMLLNKTKYESEPLKLHVIPQGCWVLEQHPNTKGYVGLQQLFGGGQLHRAVKLVRNEDYIQWEDYQEDAHTLSEAKGNAPAVGCQLIGGSSNMQKMTEVHLRNTVKRKATEDHGAYLRKCHFKFLADYLFTGAVRMHRWGLRPVLVTPQQHNNVMKQLVSQQPAQHSTLTGAAAALRTALQQQGWVLEITDLFTLILQLSCGDFAVEGALAPFLMAELIERQCVDQLLGTDSPERDQVLALLDSLHELAIQGAAAGAVLQGLPADLMLEVSRPKANSSMRSRFFWWIMDRMCDEAGCYLEVHYLSWANTKPTGALFDPAAPGPSARAAAGGQPSQLRLACLSTRHLGRRAGRQAVQVMLFPAYTGFNPVSRLDNPGAPQVTTPSVLVPPGYAANRAVRARFAAICSDLQTVTDALEPQQVAEPLYHSGLINPSNKIKTHRLICCYMQQVWVILTTAVVMWLNGVSMAQYADDQQLEQAWQDQVDQLWTPQLRHRAVVEQSTFDFARARGARYLRKYLLPRVGRPKLFNKQFNRLRRDVEAFAAETGVIFPFPADPQPIKQHLLEIINSTRFVVINSKSSNPSVELEPNNARPYNIYIGGQVLSRGITVEGLTVTLYLNASKTEVADVKLQAGRWFGHRGQYADLVRVYMSYRTRQAYKNFALAARELRNVLRDSIVKNLSWQECRRTFYRNGLLVRHTMQLTSPGKMRDALLFSSTKFLSPALDEQHSKLNFIATLELLKRLNSSEPEGYKAKPLQPEDGTGPAILPMGTLRQSAVAYHNVPLELVQQYLSNLYDNDNDTCHGVLLATCLQNSGSFVKDRVNVVVLQVSGGNSMAQTADFVECSQGIQLVGAADLNQQAAQQHAAQQAAQNHQQAQAQAQPAHEAAGLQHIPADLGVWRQQSAWDALFGLDRDRWRQTGADALAAAGASGSNGASRAHFQDLEILLRRHMLRVGRQPRSRSVHPADGPFSGFNTPDGRTGFSDQSLDAYGRMQNQTAVVYGGPPSRNWFTEPDKDGKRYRTCDAPPLVTICLANPVYAGKFKLEGAGNAEHDTFVSAVYDSQAAPAARAAAYPVPLVNLHLPRFGGVLHAAPGDARFAPAAAAAAAAPGPAAAAAPNNEPADEAASATTGAASQAGSAAGSQHDDSSSSSSDDEAEEQQQQQQQTPGPLVPLPAPSDGPGSVEPGSPQLSNISQQGDLQPDSPQDSESAVLGTEDPEDSSEAPPNSAIESDRSGSLFEDELSELEATSDSLSISLVEEHSDDSMEYDSSSHNSCTSESIVSDGSGSSWPNSDDSEENISSDPEAAGPEAPKRQRQQYSDDIPVDQIVGAAGADYLMDDGDNDASVSGAAGGAAARADVSQEGCHVDDNGGDHAGSRATPSSSADNNHTAGAAATGSHSPADLLHRKRQRNSDE